MMSHSFKATILCSALCCLLASFGSLAQADERTASQEKQGLNLLQSARAQTSSLEPPMKAALLFAIAHSLTTRDPKQASELLNNAYAIIKDFSDPAPGLNALRAEIVREAAKLSPEQVEQNLPAERGLRDMALLEIVRHALHQKQFGPKHAMELVRGMETEPQAYVAAKEVMMAIPADRADQRAEVFANILTTYRRTQHPAITAGYPEDLGTLIVRFWQSLPTALTKQAIDVLLETADPKNASEKSQSTHEEMLFAVTQQGPVNFNSYYEFRVFQVLPVLRKIDPQKAESLQASMPALAPLLDRFPAGQQSLDPTLRDTALEPGEKRGFGVTAAPPGNQSLPEQIQRGMADQALESDLASNPSDAVVRAESIANVAEQSRVLIQIASVVAVSHPTVAKEALSRILRNSEHESAVNGRILIQGADIGLKMQETDLAREFIKASNKAAHWLYDQDHDPADPNRALKLFWPSTQAWKELVLTAARISNKDATDLLADIPDPEIRALETVTLAGDWLGVPIWRSTSAMVSHKNRK